MANMKTVTTNNNNNASVPEHGVYQEKPPFQDPSRPPQYNPMNCSSSQAQAGSNESIEDDSAIIDVSPGHVTPMDYETSDYDIFGSKTTSNIGARSDDGDEGLENHLIMPGGPAILEQARLWHDAIARLLHDEYRPGIVPELDEYPFNSPSESGLLSPNSMAVEHSSGKHSISSSGYLGRRTPSPSLLNFMGGGACQEAYLFNHRGPIRLTQDVNYPRKLSIG